LKRVLFFAQQTTGCRSDAIILCGRIPVTDV